MEAKRLSSIAIPKRVFLYSTNTKPGLYFPMTSPLLGRLLEPFSLSKRSFRYSSSVLNFLCFAHKLCHPPPAVLCWVRGCINTTVIRPNQTNWQETIPLHNATQPTCYYPFPRFPASSSPGFLCCAHSLSQAVPPAELCWVGECINTTNMRPNQTS